MTFSPSLLLILICTLYTTHTIVEGFQVLPYVHIDYEHYYRLAQCQAQCAEKVCFLKILIRVYFRFFFSLLDWQQLGGKLGESAKTNKYLFWRPIL